MSDKMKDMIIKKIDELLESGEKVHKLNDGYGIKEIISYEQHISGTFSYHLSLWLKKIFIISLSKEEKKEIHQHLKSKYDATELEREILKKEEHDGIINEYFGLADKQPKTTFIEKAVDFKIQDNELKFSYAAKAVEGGLILATIHPDYMKEIDGRYSSRPRTREIITDEKGEEFIIQEKLVNWTPHILVLMPSNKNTKDIDINQTFYCKGEYISKL